MKKPWMIISIIAVLFLVILLYITQIKKEINVIKIGGILPLSGDLATYGEALKKGMDLALEKINKNDDIQGQKVQIIYEDSGGDPKTGVSAFRKLVSAHNVPIVIGAMFSNVTLAIAPIAEREKVVLLSPSSSGIGLTGAGDYIFRIYPSDVYDGVFLADFAYNKLKTRNISVVFLQVASITEVSRVFKKEYERYGGKILSMQGYNEKDTDFRTQLLKIKNEKQDLIFIPGYLREMATLLIQAKELAINTQFLSISTFYDPRIIELAGNAAEGVLFSSPMFDAKSDRPEMRDFVNKYTTKYGMEPDIIGGYGFDVVNIAALALKKADHIPDSIKEALYEIQNFPGVTGVTSFDSNGDVVKELKMMQVKGGEFISY